MLITRLLHAAWLAAMVMALAAFAWAGWLFLDSPLDVVLGIVPDDAFYYLETARNLLETGRSTADGISNTNGYHPLWMLMVVGLAWIDPGSDQLLRSAMGASLALHGVTAVVILLALRRAIGTAWGLTAAAGWLVNPLAFLITQQTVEGALYALALVLALAAYIRLGERPPGGLNLRDASVFGTALGFMCLSRTEGLVILPLAFGWLAVREAHHGGLRHAATRIAATGATTSAVLAPWLYFSWVQVGTLTQDSATMKALWAAELNQGAFEWLRNVVFTAVFFIGRSFTLLTGLDVPMEPLVIGCLALLGAARHGAVEAAGAPSRILVAVGLSVVTVWLAYGFTLTERQVWWLVLPSLSLLLVVFTVTPALLLRWKASRAVHTSAQLLLLAISLTAFLYLRTPTAALYPWQADVRSSQAAIEGRVPAAARIGVFNAGIPMFFGSAAVVSLDGLVSHQARLAWSEHRFDEFLRAADIQYIADEELALSRGLRFARSQPDLERLASFPLKGWFTKERVLWRVTWPAGSR